MLPGERENIQKENENNELNIPQGEGIHYIKKDVNGVKEVLVLTEEQFENIKDDPNQNFKEITYTQCRKFFDHKKRWADEDRRKQKLAKAKETDNDKCYYKKTKEYGVEEYVTIGELEYMINKGNTDYHEGTKKEYNNKRDGYSQRYIDSDGNVIRSTTHRKMSKEERSKLAFVEPGWRRRKYRSNKKRKKDDADNNNNNNNNNQQTIPNQLDEERNLPQSSPVVSSANAEQPENPHAFQDNSVETSENQKNIENIEINNLVARFPQFAEFRFSVNFNRTHAASQNINNNNQNNGYEIYEP